MFACLPPSPLIRLVACKNAAAGIRTSELARKGSTTTTQKQPTKITAKMGCMNSKPSYIDIEHVAGGEKEYQERFLETKKLGEGEFGEVKLVHDVKESDTTKARYLACKYLRKGFTFKDNTLFPPLKKEMLQGEVEILRRLNGEVREGGDIDRPLP